MKPRLSLESVKKAASATLAAAIFAGTLASVTPAYAAFVTSPGSFDRREVIARAKTWTVKGTPYSQVGYRNGYRRDCSGFVSMAWGLPYNLVTWTIPLVARPIPKRDLAPGDVLLNVTGDRHVVMFEKWVNSKHTAYYVLEESGQVNRAIRRKMNYPYWFQGGEYHPYRYVGLSGYLTSTRWSDRQPVWNAETKRAAAQRGAAKLAARRQATAPAAAPAPAAIQQQHQPTAGAQQATAQRRTTDGDTDTDTDGRSTGAASSAARPQQAPVNPVAMLFSTLARWMTGQPQK